MSRAEQRWRDWEMQCGSRPARWPGFHRLFDPSALSGRELPPSTRWVASALSNHTLTSVIIEPEQLESFLKASQANPHGHLGMHRLERGGAGGLVVRAFVRDALDCAVVDLEKDRVHPMERLAPEGFFEGTFPRRSEHFRYQLKVTYPSGEIRQFYDPYCFLPTLSEQDLYLFNE